MKEPARILIVDDNPDLLATFALILKRSGYAVETAEDGLAAVDKFSRQRFDVVLMDVLMPRMNGVEAFRKIQEHAPDAKVILMTAYCDEERIEKASDEGAFGTIYKPVSVPQLMNLIGRAIESIPVIIVDDDRSAGKTLARVLSHEGFQTFIASSGEEAVKLAAVRAARVALIDFRMPDMDGVETSLELKRLNPGLKSIMMTAFRDEVKDRLPETGETTACLYKPFTPGEVIRAVSLAGGKVA